MLNFETRGNNTRNINNILELKKGHGRFLAESRRCLLLLCRSIERQAIDLTAPFKSKLTA